jgi:hypothetical protein
LIKKREYFIQNIGITPKRLEIAIHNVIIISCSTGKNPNVLINVAAKLNFTIISSVRNGSCHLKK